jgi:nitrous-oxide reductase
MKRVFGFLAIALLLPAMVGACARPNVDTSGQPKQEGAAQTGTTAPSAGGQTTAAQSPDEIAQARNLSPADVAAALKTYMPSGRHDDYVLFASGGHSGQVFAIGVPSMRLLKTIAVFTPEAWQGYGFGAQGTMDTLDEGNADDKVLRWADTHHPGLSETNAEYDGEFLFIGDKANSRVGVIDLRDFETKQLIKNPISNVDHGGMFVTPNTEYVVEGGQYAMPLGGGYAPMEEYKDKYRGHITFWKFDRAAGRIDVANSFAIEVPPYWQDLCDAGKGPSDGWVFCNSFNSEMATGKTADSPDSVNFESGASQNDMDYMHVVNWKKAEELVAAGKAKEVNGFKVLPMEVTAVEGALYLIPEPKSPHGNDVTPKGEYIVVGGKLDQHASVYSFEKIQAAIAAGVTDKDEYGIPVIPFDSAIETQVELGLGPLHTVYDDKGFAYTSLFLDSAMARWTLGGDYRQDGLEPWKLVTKTPVQYNVGHVAAAEGDTASPDGAYLVAMNKWALDRFQNVGPLLPQNFQLLDLSAPDPQQMPVIYDAPIGVGEPHYAQMIKSDKLKGWEVYPEIGWDPKAMAKSPDAPQLGSEGVTRDGNNVTINLTAIRSHFTPERIELNKGDNVTLRITNVESAYDATHGFAIPVYNVNLSLEPGETETVKFVADTAGVFPYYCTEFCSALHLEMAGYMLVKETAVAQK